jgi:hypothetical protein
MPPTNRSNMEKIKIAAPNRALRFSMFIVYTLSE